MIASIAGSGEILHVRMREGRAYSGRGAARFVAEAIARARRAGARGPITVRADFGFYNNEFTAACRRAGARFSVSARDHRRSLTGILQLVRECDWIPIPDHEGADVTETVYTPFTQLGNREPVRLIIRRSPVYLGPLLDEDGDRRYRYHFSITDRKGDLLSLEKDHRRHAEVEGTIRDLKFGMGLNHFPSGSFGANAAWLWVQAMAHNICRWLRQMGNRFGDVMTASTLRRRVIAVPGRITRSRRRSILHLPRNWPWAGMYRQILRAVKAAPAPTWDGRPPGRRNFKKLGPAAGIGAPGEVESAGGKWIRAG